MAKEKKRTFLESKGFWVFATVFAGTVTSLWYHINAGTLNWITVSRLAATTFTGVWYSLRFYYTTDLAKSQTRFISLAFTFVIALCGIMSLFTINKPYWFVILAATLLLGIEKDYEIIHDLRRQIVAAPRRSNSRVWRNRLVVYHHLYSMVRDMSMAFWWLIYGVAGIYLDFNHRMGATLFATPYIILVILWCIIKDQTADVEERLLHRLNK